MTEENTRLTITSMAYGGKGVARSNGKVWFVRDCLPGDEIIARPITSRKSYVDGEVETWLQRSRLRQPSPCPVSAECGGCQWLDAPYSEQLQWKKSFVENGLQRIGRLQRDTQIPITGSPDHLHYRNRILLRAYGTGAGLVVGFFKGSSRDLVKITACYIADPLLNTLITELTKLSAPEGSKWRLECQVLGTARDQVAVTVYPGDKVTPGSKELVAKIGAMPIVAWSGLVFQLDQAPLLLLEEDKGIKYLTLPGQFQQINSALNHSLRRKIAAIVDGHEPRRILDVFCGSGNLSLAMAKPGRYVEAVESNKKAIAVGHRNAEANDLSNIRFVADDAEAHLRKCAKSGESFDLVVLDPPRQGMHSGVAPLMQIGPKVIIYVSCDPNTLARDIGALTENGVYHLVHVEALDFFPNTYHVETVAVLERQ